MYLLGPILIALASAIIVGLTYVYFTVMLPMLTGSNWVLTNDDWNSYWKGRAYGQGGEYDGSAPISQMSLILLALSTPTGILHTLLVAFFLVNILYNYYLCVKTSNSGPAYDLVVRELAEVTRFNYPESEEELVQCKKDFEKKIYEKAKKRRDEMVAARNRNNATNAASTPLGTAAPANARSNGDGESSASRPSQASQPSPLMATSTANPSMTTASPAAKNAPQPLPKIHNWQLLSPIEWGYCRYSSRPKPPRSHYDHVTKSLVLNMDHYCPWMFNCVGYFNYRYFFNFLWFVTVALFYGTAICFPAFMNLGGREYRDQVRASGGYQKSLRESLNGIVVRHNASNPYIPTPDERTPVAMGFMLCLCLAAAVMCLGSFHLYLVLSAQTTIEFHGNFAKRKKGGWKNPYSAGSWKKNWDMIYGTRYWSLHNTSGSNSTEEDQYRYRGCWGIFMAMMPSSREPEFLPLPIDGKLIRRKSRDVPKTSVDEEMGDCEFRERALEPNLNGVGSPTAIEETEFLMKLKDTNGGLVGGPKHTPSRENELCKK
eukprot:CAMPEP_0172533416 /NCGR_PEP_ID=MMETSP1067-20121228/6132_1 /TAXON_ID=265564 ORGANISM="Thalassiosira punctigera, Strain Tpunct2005C2" /NCGR_SAMPLE_ID=MMETSP1067 /ASSEMBLY_ACC=CAM_ASM_000444 /LENGTH=543 /DNA_ID=CAMNT_0013318061 /DNA_START=310 /DNA_END=1939 /DNA_ORIENTATION=+